jgi:hypothetical protein
MHRLHSLHAHRFNDRHGRDGHLFQARYGAKPIGSDDQLVVTAAYIAMNPVEAGLCRRPEDWRWSSFAATVDGSAPAWLAGDLLIERFAAVTGGDGLAAFEALVAA